MGTDVNKILKTLIGDKNAQELHETLDKAQKTLDAAGVTRKAAGDNSSSAGDGATSAGDAVLEALDSAGAKETASTVKAILDALDGIGALPAAEKAAGSHEELIAVLLKAVAVPEQEDANPADAASGAPGDQGAMAGEMMKSLTDYIATTTKDMGAMAKGQVQIAEAIKSLTAQNAEALKRVEALEAQFAGRPRQASKSTETVVEGEKGKEALDAIQKSLGDETSFLGIRVKKTA